MKRSLVFGMFAASVAHAGRCPPRATLDALAKAAWNGAAVQPKCTAIRAREPLTLVVDVALEGKLPPRSFNWMLDGGTEYAAIVDARGTVRWHQESSADTTWDWDDWKLVDLDGDGRDELIADHARVGHMGGTSSETLVVYTVGDGEARPVGLVPLASTMPAKDLVMSSCYSTHRLVRDGRRTVVEIVGKRGHDPQLTPVYDDSCPKEGKHVYLWTSQGLVEKH